MSKVNGWPAWATSGVILKPPAKASSVAAGPKKVTAAAKRLTTKRPNLPGIRRDIESIESALWRFALGENIRATLFLVFAIVRTHKEKVNGFSRSLGLVWSRSE